MNKQKRTELQSIIEELRASQNRIEIVMDDEQECFDNLTEGLQQTERGQRMEETVDILSSAIDSIEEAINALEEASA